MCAAANTYVATEAAPDRLAELVARADTGKERVILTRGGKPVAAVVPIEDFEALEAWEDERDTRIAQQALAQWESERRPPGATVEELATRFAVSLDPDAA